MTFILGAVSAVVAISITVNFDAVTTGITDAVANLLMAAVLVIVFAAWALIGRFRWENTRRFW